jgi:8-oxo-dGTP pyrophosphatase MutT (NUDIX family)
VTDEINNIESVLWPLDHPRSRIPVGGINLNESGAEPDYKAAVLIPIMWRRNGPTILFTHRSDELSVHAGQVSFPGGKIEAADIDATAAALRETHEEVGIAATAVQPLGLLDFYDTITNYRILPVVGIVREPVEICADQREVASVFEVSLGELMCEDRYQKHSVTRGDRLHHYYSYQHNEYLIWGATAGILRNLIHRL